MKTWLLAPWNGAQETFSPVCLSKVNWQEANLLPHSRPIWSKINLKSEGEKQMRVSLIASTLLSVFQEPFWKFTKGEGARLGVKDWFSFALICFSNDRL